MWGRAVKMATPQSEDGSRAEGGGWWDEVLQRVADATSSMMQGGGARTEGTQA